MTAWGFDGAHGTDTRPPHVTAAKAWAKDESVPGANDGTRLTASIVNRLVGNIRRAAELFGFTLTQTSDDDLAGIISAGIAETAQLVAEKGEPNGYAGLDGAGKVPVAQLPAIAITDTFPVANQAAMLALTAETGDIAIRSDLNQCFVLAALPASTLANWKELVVPSGTVVSVAGKTGVISLVKADVGLSKLWARGADIASASTVNLTTATGDYVLVTGTTAITAITLADGEERAVRFAGILTLTNGASLILPTAANIVTAAGDVAVFRGEAEAVRCVSYHRANGRPLAYDANLQAISGLADPNADRIMFWDDSAGAFAFLTVGSGLTISGTTLTATAGDVAATVQATTSGTSFDFTGVPAGARVIQILFDEVSTNASDHILVQIGDSGGIETSGYQSASSEASVASSTAGFIVRRGGAGDAVSGIMTLIHMGGNKWISSHSCGYVNASYVVMGGGGKTLSAELTQVRVTRSGSDTFDLGSVNIVYR